MRGATQEVMVRFCIVHFELPHTPKVSNNFSGGTAKSTSSFCRCVMPMMPMPDAGILHVKVVSEQDGSPDRICGVFQVSREMFGSACG